MNKHLVYIILLFISYTVSSQKYEPIFNKEDQVEFHVYHLVSDRKLQEKYKVKGDTIINNLNYAIIRNRYFQGYVRQNPSNSKAWFKEKNCPEKLIMNLEMTIGDSIFIDCKEYGSRYSKVISIDTSNARKIIELDYIYPEIYLPKSNKKLMFRSLKFIEGVGTNGFFLYQVNNTSFHSYGFVLISVYKNGILCFENSEGCKSLLPLPESIVNPISDKIQLQIHPRLQYLTINNQSSRQIKSILITDLNGKLLINQKIISNSQKIKTDILSKGVYLVKIFTDDKTIPKKLFIK